jgi:hypothetical protein
MGCLFSNEPRIRISGDRVYTRRIRELVENQKKKDEQINQLVQYALVNDGIAMGITGLMHQEFIEMFASTDFGGIECEQLTYTSLIRYDARPSVIGSLPVNSEMHERGIAKLRDFFRAHILKFVIIYEEDVAPVEGIVITDSK